MSTFIKTLKDRNGNFLLPRTKTTAITDSNNVALDTLLAKGVPTKVSISLPTASWSGTPYSQTVVISGVTSASKIDLQCDSTVINQLLSDGTTALYTTNNNGTISVIAVGEKPSINLTLQATISEVIV